MKDAAIELLEWDSRFFGMRIGRLTAPPASETGLANLLDSARRDGFDCLYAMLPAGALEPAWLLQRAGFVERDVRLDFERDVVAESAPTEVRGWQEEDVAALEDIAESAFMETRFAADPGFPRPAVRNLYRTWVGNSCRGYAEAVLVDGPPGLARGFVTLHVEREAARARIGLIGIAEAHRSQGVGSRLVRAALAWAAANSCRQMRVATQAVNVGAQRLYQRSGFITVSASSWYHLWMKS